MSTQRRYLRGFLPPQLILLAAAEIAKEYTAMTDYVLIHGVD
jgi:hypothetical protein